MDLSVIWFVSLTLVFVRAEGTVVSRDRIRFLREPLDRTVAAGSDVEFRCVAKCSDTADGRCRYVTWARDGVLVVDNATTSKSSNGSLMLKNVRHEAEGSYQCVVLLPTHGVFLSRRAKLTVARIGPFAEEPQDVADAVVGGAARFSCSASSSSPSPNVTWFHNGTRLPNESHDGRRKILSTGVLQITDVRHSDFGTFSCQLTNIAGTITSRQATLNVSDGAVDAVPKVIFAPRNTTVRRGDTAIFECVVQLARDIRWRRVDDSPLSSKAHVSGGNLVIPDVTPADQGMYECLAQHGESTRLSAYLTVHWPPTIEKVPEEAIRNRGDSWRLNCHTSANPEPAITWYKDGERLRSRGRIKMFPNEEILPATQRTPAGNTEYVRDLLITSIDKEDHAVYQCFADNYLGSASASAALIYQETAELTGPSNLTATVLSNQREIELSWQSLSMDLSNRSIIFIVHFHEADGSENTMAAKHDACQGGVCKVICCSNINLSPFTVYTFWVDALLDYQPPNSAPKFTKPSEKIFVRTGDAAATAASPLLVQETAESDVIKLSWRRLSAEPVKGEILEYRVELRASSSPDSNDLIWWRQPIVIPGFMKEFTLHDVDDSVLFIRVIPRTRAGYPQAYPISSFPYLRYRRSSGNVDVGNSTSSTVVAAPDVTTRSLNSSSVFVQWSISPSIDEVAAKHESSAWVVSVTRPATGQQVASTIVRYDQRWAILSNLSPDTVYQLAVHFSATGSPRGLRAISLVKTAPTNSVVNDAQSSRDVQSIVPYPTPFCETAGSGKLKISWEKPPANIIRIFVRYSLLPVDSDEPLNVSANTLIRETLDDSLVFSDLIPGRMYLFAVRAQNGAGYQSVYSHDINCSVPLATPPPPRHVQASTVNGSLLVWWTSVDQTEEVGEIISYHVRYATEPVDPRAWQELAVPGTNASVVISHLKLPSAVYMVAVSAEGVGGRGMESSTRTAHSGTLALSDDGRVYVVDGSTADDRLTVTIVRTSYVEGVIVGVSVGFVIVIFSAIVFILRSRRDHQSCVYRLFYGNRRTGLKLGNGDCRNNESNGVHPVQLKEMQTLLPILMENVDSDSKGADHRSAMRRSMPRPVASLSLPAESDEADDALGTCQGRRIHRPFMTETLLGIAPAAGARLICEPMDWRKKQRHWFTSMPDLVEDEKKGVSKENAGLENPAANGDRRNGHCLPQTTISAVQPCANGGLDRNGNQPTSTSLPPSQRCC